MLAIAIFRLRAENDAVLPRFHGRLMHGAFFSLLFSHDPALSTTVHAEKGLKPFTVSTLLPPDGKERKDSDRDRKSRFHVRRGELIEWRVTALTDEILRAVAAVPAGAHVEVGTLSLRVEEILMDSGRRKDTGIIVPEALFPAENDGGIGRITFRFRSPVSFRRGSDDFPVPEPGLIFASLADKWQGAGLMPLAEKSLIREDAALLLPIEWQGGTLRVFLSDDRGVLAFRGRVAFSLATLSPDARRILAALARLAPYSGVGRLTAQGLGWTETDIE